MIPDTHTHLAPDDDALGPQHLMHGRVRAMAAHALARGVDEIAVTEHCHRFAQAKGLLDHPMWARGGAADLDDYLELLGGARDAGLPVLAGIELDWLGAERADDLAALVDGRPFDVVLGSIHVLPPATVDHPEFPIWTELPEDEVWRRYLGALRAAAASGVFDVMSHLDLPKVFGSRLPDELADDLTATVEAVAAADVAVEINTNGLHKRCAEAYPAPPLLAALREADVPLTLGSDAHVPEHVGRDHATALQLARDAGYDAICRFRGREREEVPLG